MLWLLLFWKHYPIGFLHFQFINQLEDGHWNHLFRSKLFSFNNHIVFVLWYVLLSKWKPDRILLDQLGRRSTEHLILVNRGIDILYPASSPRQHVGRVRDISRNRRDWLIYRVLFGLLDLVSLMLWPLHGRMAIDCIFAIFITKDAYFIFSSQFNRNQRRS